MCLGLLSRKKCLRTDSAFLPPASGVPLFVPLSSVSVIASLTVAFLLDSCTVLRCRMAIDVDAVSSMI
jgi:hypothetical protein